MNVLTLKSIETLPSEVQLDIHFQFRMEHHTDYIFTDQEDGKYSSTLTLESSKLVIEMIVKNSIAFPEYTFTIDDLDLENNVIERYEIKNGEIVHRW